jgi:hypothetical protein
MMRILIRKASAVSVPSNPQVATLRATRRAIFCGFALFVVSSAALAAAPQQPAEPPPVSLDKIKAGLARTGLNVDVPIPPPRPTFKSRVDQRQFVLTLEQALHRDFDITNEIQRQNANWAAKCCGINIGQIFEVIDKALEERRIRKIREQIARELAFLEAARAAAPVVK